MAIRDLPSRPSLEQYRKQAKELLKRWKASDSEATRRLADAQHAIARDHGSPYYEIVALLVAAGAPVEPAWLNEEAAQTDPRMFAALTGKAIVPE